MRYQVVGKNHRVFGKKHGEYFERNLPEAQERHLIGGGFIVRAPLPVEQNTPVLPPVFQAAVDVVFPAEPSVSEDAPTDVEDTSDDNPRRDEF